MKASKVLQKGALALAAMALGIGGALAVPLASYADGTTDGSTTTTQSAPADTSSSTDSTASATPSDTPAPAVSDASTPAATPTQAPVVTPAPAVVDPTPAPADATSDPVVSTDTFVADIDTFNNHHGNDPPICNVTATFTHTYDSTTNSGTIHASGEFCGKTLYVTPTSWAFTKDSQWPQKLVDDSTGFGISHEGWYKYGTPVTCGQGDIYAQWDSPVVPTATLSNPSVEFTEKFLSQVSTGPTTFVVQDPSCWKAPVSGTVTYTDSTCDANNAPIGNSVVVAYTAPTTAAFTLTGPNGASTLSNLPAGTYLDNGIGTYGYPAVVNITLTGEDGSTQVSGHTFQAPQTDASCAPVETVAPSATINAYCRADGGKDVVIVGSAGTNAVVFDVIKDGNTAHPVDVENVDGDAGFEYDTTVAAGGSSTYNVMVAGATLTSTITVDTAECATSTPPPTTPPTTTPTTPPVTPAGTGGAETGMHGKQPVAAASVIRTTTSSPSGSGFGLLVLAILAIIAAIIVATRKFGTHGTAGVK